MLNIGKVRFFALLKAYRRDGRAFSIEYLRKTPGKLSTDVEAHIKKELLREKELVEDRELPISSYNFSALRDRLKKKGMHVSTTTTTKTSRSIPPPARSPGIA